MITALLVSVNYSDYLEITLQYNTKQFDQIIVLTIESDKACQEVCNKYLNVKCLVFPDRILKKNGKQFNKGAILNSGLRYLDRGNYSDWLVLTDSDIIFPENFKEFMTSKEKDPNVLYGMKRKHCFTLKNLNLYIKTKNVKLLREFNELKFIGCCQIFLYQVGKFSFVENCNAERYDMIFLRDFYKKIKQYNRDSKTKILIEDDSVFQELSEGQFVIHLGEHAKNWEGRVTEKFI